MFYTHIPQIWLPPGFWGCEIIKEIIEALIIQFIIEFFKRNKVTTSLWIKDKLYAIKWFGQKIQMKFWFVKRNIESKIRIAKFKVEIWKIKFSALNEFWERKVEEYGKSI